MYAGERLLLIEIYEKFYHQIQKTDCDHKFTYHPANSIWIWSEVLYHQFNLAYGLNKK